jgi:hypothetical protein
MEHKLWQTLYRWIMAAAKTRRRAGVTYSDAWICLVFLWGVVHDRPRSWAVEPAHWPPAFQAHGFPSTATLSRRLKTASVRALLDAAWAACAPTGGERLVKWLDAKPLPVGSMSKDPDARWGQAAKAKAKGYKLFCLWGPGPRPVAWALAAMNADEATTAKEALLPRLEGGGYVLGDCAYDENALYDAAWARGHQLVAPRKRPGTGLGHRRHSPQRLRSVDLLEGRGREGRSAFAARLYALRTDVERRFSRLTVFGGGLGPLPAWVRRLHRVRLWVHAKLLIRAAADLSIQRT